VVIALCAKEPDKLANAETKMKEYAGKGCVFYAPGAIIAEARSSQEEISRLPSMEAR
jgi:hypothetical protein